MTDKSISHALNQVLKKEIDQAITDELKGIQERVEARVRSNVGRIVAQTFTFFSMERFGTDLKITVKFDDTKT